MVALTPGWPRLARHPWPAPRRRRLGLRRCCLGRCCLGRCRLGRRGRAVAAGARRGGRPAGNRAGLGVGVVGDGRRGLGAQLGDEGRHVRHDRCGSLTQRGAGQPPACPLGQVHRRAGYRAYDLAREELQILASVGEDVLSAPMGDRDDRGAGRQGQPGDASLGDHRPQLGIAGRGTFRVDDHRGAVCEGLLSLLQDQGGVRPAPVHGQLPRLVQHPADELDLERLRLDHERRVPAVRLEEQRVRPPVHVGQVVRREDDRSRPGNVLRSLPLVPDQAAQQRMQDHDGEQPPGRRVSLGHLRGLRMFVVSVMWWSPAWP